MPSELIERLGWTLIHFVWQGAIAAIVCALLLFIIRRRSANMRYLISLFALMCMALAPVVTFLSPTLKPTASPRIAFEQPTPMQSDSPAATGNADLPIGRTTQPPQSTQVEPTIGENSALITYFHFANVWLNWLVAAWALGVAILSIRLCGGLWRVRRLTQHDVQPAAQWLDQLNDLTARLRVTRPVRLLESTLAAVPMTIGFFKPVILLPVSALSGLAPEQIEALIAHELAHIRRHDYAINLAQTVIETLLFYHPAVWWVSRRIRLEREFACDDLAAQACGNSLTYARALVEMETLRSAPAPAMSANAGPLTTRISRLLGRQPEQKSSSWLAGLLAIALLALIGLLYSFSARPASAQTNTAPPDFVVEGTVTDESGKPMQGVVITHVGGTGTLWNRGKPITTGPDGRYTFHWAPDRAGHLERNWPRFWSKRLVRDEIITESARFYADKEGFYEKDLCRQGDLAEAGAIDPKAVYPDPKRTILPGKPRRVDFVMVEAAHVSGRVITPAGDPVAGIKLTLCGTVSPIDYPLAGAETDQAGRFKMPSVPCRPCAFTFTDRGREIRSQGNDFSRPGDYELLLEYDSRAQTLKRHTISTPEKADEIASIKDADGPKETHKPPDSFKSGSEYLEVPDSPLLDVGDYFMIEGWIRCNEAHGETAVVSKEIPWKSGYTLIVAGNGANDNQFDLTFGVGDGNRFKNLTAPDAIKRGELTHVAAAYSNHYVSLWVNGKEVAFNKLGYAAPAGVPLRIGKASADLGRNFVGEIQRLAIWTDPNASQFIKPIMEGKVKDVPIKPVAAWAFTGIENGVFSDHSPNHLDAVIKGPRGMAPSDFSDSPSGPSGPPGPSGPASLAGNDQTKARHTRGHDLIDKMLSVNRLWLSGPAPAVQNFEYSFKLGDKPASIFKVGRPIPQFSSKRQGITWFTILQSLARSPASVTIKNLTEENNQIKLDIAFPADQRIEAGNGIENSWRGYFSSRLQEATIWIDKDKMIPLRASTDHQIEHYSDYVDAGGGQFVPLSVEMHHDDKMHFAWSFKLYPPGLWLLDHARYSARQNVILPTVAEVSDVKINDAATSQAPAGKARIEKINRQFEDLGRGHIANAIKLNRAWLTPPLEARRGLVYEYRQEPPYREVVMFDQEGRIMAELTASKESPTTPTRQLVYLSGNLTASANATEPYVKLTDYLNPEGEHKDRISDSHLRKINNLATGLAWDCALTRIARNPDAWNLVLKPGKGTDTYSIEATARGDARIFAGTMLAFTSWAYMHDVRYSRAEIQFDAMGARPYEEKVYNGEGKLVAEFRFSHWLQDPSGQAPGRIQATIPYINRDGNDQTLDMDAQFGFAKPGVWLLKHCESKFRNGSGHSKAEVTILPLEKDSFAPIEEILARINETNADMSRLAAAPEGSTTVSFVMDRQTPAWVKHTLAGYTGEGQSKTRTIAISDYTASRLDDGRLRIDVSVLSTARAEQYRVGAKAALLDPAGKVIVEASSDTQVIGSLSEISKTTLQIDFPAGLKIPAGAKLRLQLIVGDVYATFSGSDWYHLKR